MDVNGTATIGTAMTGTEHHPVGVESFVNNGE